MKVSVKFAGSWFFSEGGRHIQATKKAIAFLKQQMGDSINSITSSTNYCQFSYVGECSPEELAAAISALIRENLLDGKALNVFTIEIDGRDYSVSASEIPDVSGSGSPENDPTNKTQEPVRTPANPPSGAIREEKKNENEEKKPASLQERLDELVGADELKALCHDLGRIAPSLLAHNAAEIVRGRSYLFSVDPGSGYHTSLDLLSRTLRETGLVPELDDIEEFQIPVENNMSDAFPRFVDDFTKSLRSRRPKVIALDISNWLDQTGNPSFRNILLAIQEHNKNKVVVFRTPYRSSSTLETIARDLGDILSVKTVSIKPFSNEQLHELARRTLDKFNYKMAEDSWPVFDRIISLEKSDGYFYGVSTVRKITHDIVYDMQKWSLDNGSDSSEIPPEAITSFDLDNSEDNATLSDLDQMIGMETVADRVRSILDQISYAHAVGAEAPAMHMAFVGNPGTGKTTVARIVGSVLKQRGYLRIGKFFERHGRELVGQYVGHTAMITKQICEQAYGSVLFIDEAYSLASGTGGMVDYGKEAVDTLIAQMENHREDMIVILAGYPKQMDDLFAMNPGMRDRVRYVVEFPNYTREQLYEIFMLMSGKRFKLSDDYKEHAKKFFDSLPDSLLQSSTFGNARFARNLYENAWAHAIRAAGNQPTENLVLTAEDFVAAAALAEVPQEKAQVKIGF